MKRQYFNLAYVAICIQQLEVFQVALTDHVDVATVGSPKTRAAQASPAQYELRFMVGTTLLLFAAAAVVAAATPLPSSSEALGEAAMRAISAGSARRAYVDARSLYAAARARFMSAHAAAGSAVPNGQWRRGDTSAADIAPATAQRARPVGDLRVGVEFVVFPIATIDIVPLIYGPWCAANGSLADVDADGWPTSDAYSTFFDLAPSPFDPEAFIAPAIYGTYYFDFEGRGNVMLYPPGPALQLLNMTFDASTFRTSGYFSLAALPGAVPGVAFAISNTARKSGGAGFRLLRVLQPGFTAADVDAGQVFLPAVLELMAPFNQTRVHEWSATNTVLQRYPATIEWSERRAMTDAHWGLGDAPKRKAVGAPWETVILLSHSAVGHDGAMDVWINVPVYATGIDPLDTASYVYQLALLLRDGNAFTGGHGLDPRAVLFVEHANELWLNTSSGSSVYAWNLAAAVAEVAAGGSVLNSDGATDPVVWARRRHAKRLLEISLIFAAVFGAAEVPRGRVRPVFAWMQTLATEGSETLAWLESVYGTGTVAARFGAYAVNAYRVPFMAPNSSVADVYAELLIASDEASPSRAASTAIAAGFGLPLYSYEGAGWPQFTPGDNATITTVIQANRGWPMASQERYDLLANWIPVAGPASAYNFYCLAAPVGFDTLGLLEQVQNYSGVPKFDGVLELVYGSGAGNDTL